MKHHTTSTFNKLDTQPVAKRSRIKERDLADILIETFEFMTLQKPEVGEFKDMPKPRILFGKNTSLPFDQTSSDASFESQALGQTKSPLHFTFEYADPLNKVRVARTYFTTLNTVKSYFMEQRKDYFEKLEGYNIKTLENEHFNDEK